MEDRELLIRIDENVKSLKESFLGHVESDASTFGIADKRMNTIGTKLDSVKQFQWMLIGAIIVLNVFIPFVFEIFKTFNNHPK